MPDELEPDLDGNSLTPADVLALVLVARRRHQRPSEVRP